MLNLYNTALIQHVREVLNPQSKRKDGVIKLQTFFNETGQMLFSQSVTRGYTSYCSDDDSDDYSDDYSDENYSRRFRNSQRNGMLGELLEHLSNIRHFDCLEFPVILETAFLKLNHRERSRAVVLAKLIAQNPETIIWVIGEEVEKRIDESGDIIDIVTEDLRELSLE